MKHMLKKLCSVAAIICIFFIADGCELVEDKTTDESNDKSMSKSESAYETEQIYETKAEYEPMSDEGSDHRTGGVVLEPAYIETELSDVVVEHGEIMSVNLILSAGVDVDYYEVSVNAENNICIHSDLEQQVTPEQAGQVNIQFSADETGEGSIVVKASAVINDKVIGTVDRYIFYVADDAFDAFDYDSVDNAECYIMRNKYLTNMVSATEYVEFMKDRQLTVSDEDLYEAQKEMSGSDYNDSGE